MYVVYGLANFLLYVENSNLQNFSIYFGVYDRMYTT